MNTRRIFNPAEGEKGEEAMSMILMSGERVNREKTEFVCGNLCLRCWRSSMRLKKVPGTNG
jgi:hypothetical protein